MMNESHDALVLEAATRTSVPLGSILPVAHNGLVGQSSRNGEVTFDNLAGQNNLYVTSPGLSNIFSEIALPLKFQKEVLGVLDIQSERMHAFSLDDIAVLQVTAAQIAVALRNARLYSELMRLNKGFDQVSAMKS
jgi:GAF domain-containing protein